MANMQNYLTLIVLAVGLSMDAFAVSLCDGLSMQNTNKKKALFISGVFGIMQGIMPLIGYRLGRVFLVYIESVDHYIAFGLLLLIGGKMLFDGIKALVKGQKCEPKNFSMGSVLLQGLATSVDALAVGISLLAMPISIWIDISVIAVITFGICLVGVLLGKAADRLFKGKTEIATVVGGCILVLIGIKILIEHLLA